MAREIPRRFTRKLKVWYASFAIWRIVHYALGIGAIVCSTIVASLKSDLSHSVAKLSLGMIAVILTALVTFLNPNNLSKAYIRAWRVLNAACGDFQFNASTTESIKLAAEKRGEGIIAGAE